MSATSAPELEQAQAVISTPEQTNDDEAYAHQHDQEPSSDLPPEVFPEPLASAVHIKVENEDPNETTERGQNGDLEPLEPTLEPNSSGREPDVAASAPEEDVEVGKKRKRPASPPWHFPTAETSTLKSVDGRRISARVYVATPGASEKEESGRSVSRPASRSRAVSPPWKRFAAEGPTSIRVDGVRKSGRVNRELADSPKRISPRLRKQMEKASSRQGGESKAAAARKSVGFTRKIVDGEKRRPIGGRHRIPNPSSEEEEHTTEIANLKRQIAALQPSRSYGSSVKEGKRGHKRTHSNVSKASTGESQSPSHSRNTNSRRSQTMSPEASRSAPKIKLRLSSTRHIVPPPHPQAKIPSPPQSPRLSLHQVIEHHELRELQQPYMENDRNPPDADFFVQRAVRQAADEGALRIRLLKQAEPGGALSKERLSLYQDERQPEPLKQYGHEDHLVAHALHFRHLMLREQTIHRALAKKIAYEAVDYWRLTHGPTEEDLIAEQKRTLDLMKKQVVVDIDAKWKMVDAHVREAKRVKWEAEQEKLRAKKLQQKLEWSQGLLAKQRRQAESESDLENEDSTGDLMESEDEDSDDDLDENMSQSGSESPTDEDEEDGEMDESALADYLARRAVEAPSLLPSEIPDGHEEDQDRWSDDGSEREGEDEDADEDEDEDEVDDSAIEDAPPAEGQPGGANHPRVVAGSATETPVPAMEDEVPNLPDVNMTDENSEPGIAPRRQRQSSVLQTDEEAEVEDHLSSDESTNMDSTDYDSDEDLSSTGDEDNGADQGEDSSGDESGSNKRSSMKNSLLAFYSAKDLLRERDGGLPTPVTSVENGGDNENARSHSEGESEERADAQDLAEKIAIPPQDEVVQSDEIMEENVSENDAKSAEHEAAEEDALGNADIDVDMKSDEDETVTGARITPPSLLRGTLRSYQLAGLDWLASLYRNGTNGILADEMGLGKTIQTIALLAHLAEHYAVWETHLIIVPTSVILNWVTEFQRFLPGFRVLGYYGTAEERQAKRRGWVNDPHHENRDKRGYNVIITSYNVAMQDINAIRSVPWHYLVLDEAHNIRNFNSQRWQVLIRLRTKARLLLTGTPLQNNLAEVWALLTFLTAGDDERSHGELEEFLGHWKDPVKEIFDKGVQTLSAQAQKVVDQLHVSLRPFLLRRVKNEVEKDLPKKTESVVVCKLSKRQRQLYQDYMGLAEIKATLAKGSGVQAGAVLLSLRRVCNHPDLFDPRPIQTSFAMERSPLNNYSPKEQLIRRLLGVQNNLPETVRITEKETQSRSATLRSRQLAAFGQLQHQVDEIECALARGAADISTLSGTRALQHLRRREKKLEHLRSSIEATRSALSTVPIYGADIRELATIRRDRPYVFKMRRAPGFRALHAWPTFSRRPLRLEHLADWALIQSTQLHQDVLTPDRLAERMGDIIVRFAFVPPTVTAPILNLEIPPRYQERFRLSDAYPRGMDFAHEVRVRTSIAFPDSRLLIYDSGKLQRLTYLLRELQAKGSRSLIFTQMTGTLNVLERFLNLLNLPYLRLDGSTPVERRQLYSAEFNRPDSKYQCMILSSRAGGVGLNLTGASSVIFYDLDWNPQMDRQCMDRAHRIGQVRDVEVYKMVSEKTVEENILRRANQKSLLDQTVIQDGHFTTEHRLPALPPTRAGDGEEDEDGGVAAAIERFLGGGEKTTTQALESVEDREDVAAAQQARKEDHQDDVDFYADRSSKGASKANTPGPAGADLDLAVDDERKGHLDLYMIRYMEFLLRDQAYAPPPAKKLDKYGRDPGHRPKKKR